MNRIALGGGFLALSAASLISSYYYYQEFGAIPYAKEDSKPVEIVPNAAYQLVHSYSLYGIPVHRTMTVCRLRGGDLLFFNPVRVSSSSSSFRIVPESLDPSHCTETSSEDSSSSPTSSVASLSTDPTSSASPSLSQPSPYLFVVPNAHTRLQDRSLSSLLYYTPSATLLAPLQARSALSSRLPDTQSLELFARGHPDIQAHRLPMSPSFDEVVLEVDLATDTDTDSSSSPDPSSVSPRKLLLFGDVLCNPLKPVSLLDRVATTIYGFRPSAGPQIAWAYRLFGVADSYSFGRRLQQVVDSVKEPLAGATFCVGPAVLGDEATRSSLKKVGNSLM